MPGKIAGADHRENRHRLGKAVDAGPPLLAEQEQNRRNQRAGVADADPEHEVDDVKGPEDRGVVAPHADAGRDQVADQRQRTSRPSDDATAERDVPSQRRLGAFGDRADHVGDRGEVLPAGDQGRPPPRVVERVVDHCRHGCSIALLDFVSRCRLRLHLSASVARRLLRVARRLVPLAPRAKAGCGLRIRARYTVRGLIFNSASMP